MSIIYFQLSSISANLNTCFGLCGVFLGCHQVAFIIACLIKTVKVTAIKHKVSIKCVKLF